MSRELICLKPAILSPLNTGQIRNNPILLCRLAICVRNDIKLRLILTAFLLNSLSWLYKVISLPFSIYYLASIMV